MQQGHVSRKEGQKHRVGSSCSHLSFGRNSSGREKWGGERVLFETSRAESFTRTLASTPLTYGVDQTSSFLTFSIYKMRLLHCKGSLNEIVDSFNRCMLTANYVLAKDNK